VIHY